MAILRRSAVWIIAVASRRARPVVPPRARRADVWLTRPVYVLVDAFVDYLRQSLSFGGFAALPRSTRGLSQR